MYKGSYSTNKGKGKMKFCLIYIVTVSILDERESPGRGCVQGGTRCDWL